MNTRLTQLLGIRHPVIQAGMSLVSYVPLAAAVSNAGGLGILTVSDQSPQELRENIQKLRSLTGGKPFGVNAVPYVPAYGDLVRVILEEKVPVFSHGLGNPFKLLKLKKPDEMVFMPTAGTVAQAMHMEKEGADAVIVHGFEGGGHVGHIASSIIIPKAADCLHVPVVASGGFCDGRGLVSALALGAEGIAMGTRFFATHECPVHPNAKEAVVRAAEEEAVVNRKIDGLRLRGIPGTLLKNYNGWPSRPWEVIPGILSNVKGFKISFREMLRIMLEFRRHRMPVVQFLCGCARFRNTFAGGNVENGFTVSGQVTGRIQDIPACRELIERIVQEAEETIKSLHYNLSEEKRS